MNSDSSSKRQGANDAFPPSQRVAVNVAPGVASMIDALGAVNTVEFFKWSIPRMDALSRAHVIRTADAAIFRDPRYFSALVECAHDVLSSERIDIASPELMVMFLVAETITLSEEERSKCCKRIVAATPKEVEGILDDMIKYTISGSSLVYREFVPSDVVRAVAMVVNATRGPVEAFLLFHRAEQWGATFPELVASVCTAVAESAEVKHSLVSRVLNEPTTASHELPCDTTTSMWCYLQLVADLNAGAVPFKVRPARGLCKKHCSKCMQLLVDVNVQCSDPTACAALMTAGPLRARAIVLQWLAEDHPVQLLRMGFITMHEVMGLVNGMSVVQRAECGAFIRTAATKEQLEVCWSRLPGPEALAESRRRNPVYDAVLVASVERWPEKRDKAWLSLIRAALYADAIHHMANVIASTEAPVELRAKLATLAHEIVVRPRDVNHKLMRKTLIDTAETAAFDQVREATRAMMQQFQQLALTSEST